MIPVVFIHEMKGDPPPGYLLTALRQAKSYNAKIVLLGDANVDSPGVEFCPLLALSREAEEFASCYRHMSSNPRDFELFCFQRHFVVKAFMRARGIDKAFVCDSDVMLYCDVTREEKRLPAGYAAAYMLPRTQPPFRWVASSAASYWTQRGISDFCDLIHRAYTTELFSRLEDKWRWHRDNGKPGGICDMTLLWMFAQHRDDVAELTGVRDGATFDTTINTAENEGPQDYRMKDGRKEIVWDDGIPSGYHRILRQHVRFNSLHFQGAKAKRWMAEYLREKTESEDEIS